MLKFKKRTLDEKLNIIFVILMSFFLVLSISFGTVTYLTIRKADWIARTNQLEIDTMKSKLDIVSTLNPIEGSDADVIKMLLKVLGKGNDKNIKIKITDTSSPLVSTDGKITYGNSKNNTKVTFTVLISKGNSSFAKNLIAVIPENKITPILTAKSVNAKDYGAKGDGLANDTASIQKAVDYISQAGGGTVNIPTGMYIINPDVSINMKNNVQLSLSDDATLKSSANSSGTYEIINIIGVNNVKIFGGNIIGDRTIHRGTVGEWGMGIRIDGSTNVNITDVNITDCWGDGIYIGGKVASDVIVSNVVSDNNRRQGLSITNAKNVTISDSEFKNTNGTAPQAGIDLEPNPNQAVEGIKINNVQFLNNKGSGIDIFGAKGPISHIEITNSLMKGNSGIGVMMSTVSDVVLTNDFISESVFGVEIKNDVNNVTLTNLNIFNNQSRGVSIVSDEQKMGIENITFKDTTIFNNSQANPGTSDGVRIDPYDSTGYIKNIKFMNTKFIDNQKSHTQNFGLTVGNSKLISDITLYDDCIFSGNLAGDLYSPIPISKNVPR